MVHVQSYISSISFPATIDDAWRMGDETDIDLLLNADSYYEPITWTAPRWVERGDIVFFYHTKSAKQQAIKLRKDAQHDHSLTRAERRGVSRLLESAGDQADRFSGMIFGCAEASGSIERPGQQGGHFRTPFSVPLGRVHIFDHPLPYDSFRDIVQIGQGPVTRLYKPQFEPVKELLASQNKLPTYLREADAAETECPDVDQTNWPHVSCSESVRFTDEAHLRLCLLDYLLEDLKDPETPLLKECSCYIRRRWRGKADYFVSIHGDWIPVEAKLNILSEPDLLGQISQYTRARRFKSTQGIHEGEEVGRKTRGAPDVGLIVDQSGVYIASSKEFLGCSPGEPIWRREELDHSLVLVIRDRIREVGRR